MEKISNKIEIFVDGKKIGEVERLKECESLKIKKIKMLNEKIRYSSKENDESKPDASS
jgi:hypothetical protein